MKKQFSIFLTAFALLLITSSCEKALDPKTEPKILKLQPGATDGQDCLVAYRESDNNLYATSNHKPTTDFAAIRWTYNGDNAGEGTNRTYVKFTGLSGIPASANILSAKISLFGVTSGVAASLGNSYFTGSPYESSGSNAAWLKRVLNDWSDSTITWNTKPATTDEYQAGVAASTSQWNYSVSDIDVTTMVKAMVNGHANYGFCLQLQKEEIYRSILFGSSETTDSTKRPRLVVEYEEAE